MTSKSYTHVVITLKLAKNGLLGFSCILTFVNENVLAIVTATHMIMSALKKLLELRTEKCGEGECAAQIVACPLLYLPLW
jgi:hypothetical protein